MILLSCSLLEKQTDVPCIPRPAIKTKYTYIYGSRVWFEKNHNVFIYRWVIIKLIQIVGARRPARWNDPVSNNVESFNLI